MCEMIPLGSRQFHGRQEIVADKIRSDVGVPFRESVRWGQMGNERVVWKSLVPCTKVGVELFL